MIMASTRVPYPILGTARNGRETDNRAIEECPKAVAQRVGESGRPGLHILHGPLQSGDTVQYHQEQGELPPPANDFEVLKQMILASANL